MRVAVVRSRLHGILAIVPVRVDDEHAWKARLEQWGEDVVEIVAPIKHPDWRVLYEESDVVALSPIWVYVAE